MNCGVENLRRRGIARLQLLRLLLISRMLICIEPCISCDTRDDFGITIPNFIYENRRRRSRRRMKNDILSLNTEMKTRTLPSQKLQHFQTQTQCQLTHLVNRKIRQTNSFDIIYINPIQSSSLVLFPLVASTSIRSSKQMRVHYT